MRTPQCLLLSAALLACVACQPDVHVAPAEVTVNVPPDPTPPANPTPPADKTQIDVHVPMDPTPITNVTVNVPPDPTAAAPEVHVDVHLPPDATPSESPPPTTADLCLDIASSDGRPMPFRVTLDGDALPMTCATVDPLADHTFTFGAIDGYAAPEPVTVRAGTVPAGMTRTIPVLYTAAPPAPDPQQPVVCLVTVNQFGGVVPAPISVRGEEFSGRACAVLGTEDAFDIGDLAGYTPPVQRIYHASDFTNRTRTVTYEFPNGGQLCAYRRNAADQDLAVAMRVDGVSTIDPCVAFDVRIPHDVVYDDVPGLWTPYPYRLRADVIPVGETLTVTATYRSGTLRPMTICVAVYPDDVILETFVDGQSIGWSLGTEYPCSIVDADATHLVSFGRSDGHRSPVPITIEPNQQGFATITVPALADADRFALACIRTRDPWGQEISVPVTIAERPYPPTWGHPQCAAIDPTTDVTTTFGEFGGYLAPDPLVIPAGALRAGDQQTFDVVYVVRTDPQPPKPATGVVHVVGPAVDGVDVPLPVPSRINDELTYGWTSTITWSLTDEHPTVVEFLAATPGLAPPTPLTVDPNDPEASGGVYDVAQNTWSWTVRYTAEAPVALACVDQRDHNGAPLRGSSAPSVMFDVEHRGLQFDDLDRGQYRDMPCTYLTVGGDHIITTGSLSYHAQPEPITIPADVLIPDTIATFGVVHVLSSHQGTICVTTVGARGEIIVNDVSIGWNASDDDETCVQVNRTEVAALRFGDVAGHTTPEPIAVNLALPVTFGGGGGPSPSPSDAPPARFIFGFYDADRLALGYIRARDPWGNNLAAPVAVGTNPRTLRWDRPIGVVIDPSLDTTITFVPTNGYVPPDPIAIPANTLRPGARYTYVGDYTTSPSTYANGVIRIVGPIVDGRGDVPVVAVIMMNSELRGNDSTMHFSIDAASNAALQVDFSVEEIGLRAPEPLTIDQRDPVATGGTYDSGQDTWTWVVRCTATEPVALICVDRRDYNEHPFDGPGVLVDGRDVRTTVMDLPCTYVTTREPHIVTSWWTSGFVQPHPVAIPPNVLAAGTIHTFRMTHVPQIFAAALRITTWGAVGEIFLDGGSVGWNGTPGLYTDVVLTASRRHVVTFGDATGYGTPSPITVMGAEIAPGALIDIAGEYQHMR